MSAEAMQYEWVQCDKCQKWRGLKPEDFKSVVQRETWYCFQNPDVAQASCDLPQILTDSEIDAIYRKRQQEVVKTKKPVHPVIWQEIHANVYTYKRRTSWKEDDIAICQCRPDSQCLENCINRMLNIECTQGFCPCGGSCTNQRFSRRQHASVNIRPAGLKGFGLFCTEDIGEGDFVTEYMGEIIDEAEYTRRRNYYAENGHKHYYFMQIGNGEVIDACRMGNAGRFMNHSCEPNCETQKWVVKGELCVGFFALRNIKAGEELTFNYNFQTEKPIRCVCGSIKCKGTIGGQKMESSQLDDTEVKGLEIPDPIMLKEEEMDDIMRAVLARQVGIREGQGYPVDQIHLRLRDLYWKNGLSELADSLEIESATDSGLKMRETSSGDSSSRQTSSALGRSKGRKRSSRSKATVSSVDRRGKLGWKPDPERKRSEVDFSLSDITAASGKLYNPSRKNILKVLRLFNLVEIGMNEKERQEAERAREKEQKTREELERSGKIHLGTAVRSQPRQQPIHVAGYIINGFTAEEAPLTARQRAQFADLSLLLDVVQHTIDPVARHCFIDCGILSQLQQVIGRNFASQYSVMLRKILRVVDCLPLRPSHFERTRSAHGTMGNLIAVLTHHKDNGVRNIALSIARQHNIDCEADVPEDSVSMPCRSRRNSTETRSSKDTTTDQRSRWRSSGFSRGGEEQKILTSQQSHGQETESGNWIQPSVNKSNDQVRSEMDATSGISLPPGFGYSKPQRDIDVAKSITDVHPMPRESLEARRKEIQQRIVRKLHLGNQSNEGLFSKELGKMDHVAQLGRQEVLIKEAKELEEERLKRQRLNDPLSELDGWDHLGHDFQEFVRSTLRQRIQKYQQPEHPLKLSSSEAETLFKKLYASIIESEENAFRLYARDRLRRHVSKVKLALNIKEFTSKTMHNYYDMKLHQS